MALPRFLAAVVVLVMFSALAVGAAVEGARQTAPKPVPAVSHLPARFEGQGALTLGCSLWDTPWLDTSEDAKALPRRFVLLWMTPDPTGELSIHFSARHPEGVVTVDGEQCGLSINWAAFGEPEKYP